MSEIATLRIGVLAGGPSSEREVSLRSGAAVYQSLKKKGYNVTLIDVSADLESSLAGITIDAAFIALHGGAGEDGTIQKILERRHIPYTGSGPRASLLALDKIAAKRKFQDHSVPTPPFYTIRPSSDSQSIPDGFAVPLVIKPSCEGSSVGLSIVRTEEALGRAVTHAFTFGREVLVEKFIEGRELTVGILDDKALPVVEIVAKNMVYDYGAKYVDTETRYIVPAVLSGKEGRQAQALGLKAHHALECRDLSRVDIRMDPKGSMFVLEVNTIPGMTERSLLPKAAQAAGIEFDALCSRLLELALKRR
ncbi:MAG: D-alanine--D-alanine ligase [Candidatus Omnitrophica bacterium]|nr:D-alanine--D-alanine ligase [Candidatus Omnitrophota bacterium]